MKFVVVLILTGCMGCTTTSYVSSNQEKSYYTFQKFNTMAQSEVFAIEMKDGKTLEGTNLFAQPDSTRWRNTRTNSEQCVATNDISYVSKTNRFAGAVEGFFIGATAGAVATLPFYSSW